MNKEAQGNALSGINTAKTIAAGKSLLDEEKPKKAHFTARIDAEALERLRDFIVYQREGYSISSFIQKLTTEYIDNYEKKNGEIPPRGGNEVKRGRRIS